MKGSKSHPFPHMLPINAPSVIPSLPLTSSIPRGPITARASSLHPSPPHATAGGLILTPTRNKSPHLHPTQSSSGKYSCQETLQWGRRSVRGPPPNVQRRRRCALREAPSPLRLSHKKAPSRSLRLCPPVTRGIRRDGFHPRPQLPDASGDINPPPASPGDIMKGTAASVRTSAQPTTPRSEGQTRKGEPQGNLATCVPSPARPSYEGSTIQRGKVTPRHAGHGGMFRTRTVNGRHRGDRQTSYIYYN